MSPVENPRPPFPPYDAETAAQKARMAEDAWNSRNPERRNWTIGSSRNFGHSTATATITRLFPNQGFEGNRPILRSRRRVAGSAPLARSREVPSAAAGGDIREARKSSS